MTPLPLHSRAWRHICETVHRVLVRPRYYIGRDESGDIDEFLVHRGHVYINRGDDGAWQVDLRGVGAHSGPYPLRAKGPTA